MYIALAIILGILPSIIWLIFFDQESKRRRGIIGNQTYAFILGSVVTFFALFIQLALNKLFLAHSIDLHSPIGITAFAAVEEVLKFIAVFFIVGVRPRLFKEPLDAMIFMITVALGFAAAENVASLITQAHILSIGLTVHSFELLALRFLGATLLHSLASAVVGFHWAVGLLKKKLVAWHIVGGLLVATLLHSIFNYLILKTGPASWAIVFVITISFFVLIDFEKLKIAERK